MVKGCGAQCAKYFLFVLNVLFFIAGAVILGIGIWARVDKKLVAITESETRFGEVVDTKWFVHTAAAIFIAFGTFVFVVGFLGCCGAIRESKCLLALYISFIAVVVVGELAAGIFAVVKFKDFSKSASEGIAKDIKLNYPSSGLSADVMTKLNCCGWNDYRDFVNSNYTKATNLTVPPECCQQRDQVNLLKCRQEAAENTTSRVLLITKGCMTSIGEKLQPFAMTFIGVSAGIAVIELVVLVAAILLCVSVKEE